MHICCGNLAFSSLFYAFDLSYHFCCCTRSFLHCILVHFSFSTRPEKTSYKNNIKCSKLFLAYEYILTLSFTYVSCERASSKLKQVKIHLRSTLGNEKLEAFMSIGCERDLLESISPDDINRYISVKSAVFKHMLNADYNSS